MFNEQFLSFNVLTKPEKDLFNVIQSNAKFKSLNDIIKTKVGINNFYNFSITLKSSILFRDIVLNSQFVSAWARSTQVLNDNDSKYARYKFLTKSEEETNKWINMIISHKKLKCFNNLLIVPNIRLNKKIEEIILLLFPHISIMEKFDYRNRLLKKMKYNYKTNKIYLSIA